MVMMLPDPWRLDWGGMLHSEHHGSHVRGKPRKCSAANLLLSSGRAQTATAFAAPGQGRGAGEVTEQEEKERLRMLAG